MRSNSSLPAPAPAIACSSPPGAFPSRGRPENHPRPPRAPFIDLPDEGLDYERTLTLIERNLLEQALRKTGGNKKAAAAMLGLKRTTLAAKVSNLESLASVG